MEINTIYYIIILGIALFFIGRYYKDFTTGILGGLIIFFTGLFILIDPITGIERTFSDVLGMVFFGLGGYIWIVGGIELLKEKGWY